MSFGARKVVPVDVIAGGPFAVPRRTRRSSPVGWRPGNPPGPSRRIAPKLPPRVLPPRSSPNSSTAEPYLVTPPEERSINQRGARPSAMSIPRATVTSRRHRRTHETGPARAFAASRVPEPASRRHEPGACSALSPDCALPCERPPPPVRTLARRPSRPYPMRRGPRHGIRRQGSAPGRRPALPLRTSVHHRGHRQASSRRGARQRRRGAVARRTRLPSGSAPVDLPPEASGRSGPVP